MILSTADLLSLAHFVLNGDDLQVLSPKELSPESPSSIPPSPATSTSTDGSMAQLLGESVQATVQDFATPPSTSSTSVSPSGTSSLAITPSAPSEPVEENTYEGSTYAGEVSGWCGVTGYDHEVANQTPMIPTEPQAGPSRLPHEPRPSHAAPQKRRRDSDDSDGSTHSRVEKENMPLVPSSSSVLHAACPPLGPPLKRARVEPAGEQIAAPEQDPLPAPPASLVKLCLIDGCRYHLTMDYDEDNNHLNRVHKTKNAEKRFPCNYPGCTTQPPTGYSTKCNRNKHITGGHWGYRFSCNHPGCTAEYPRRDELTRHKNDVQH